MAHNRRKTAGWKRPVSYFQHGKAANIAARVVTPTRRTLATALAAAPVGVEHWRRIGACIGRLHAHGVHHADLNAHNLLLDTQGRAIAALTVPYSERIDQSQRKSIPAVTEALGQAARTLSQRVGGLSMGAFTGKRAQADAPGRPNRQARPSSGSRPR